MTKPAQTDSRLSQVQASFASECMRVALHELKIAAKPWAETREMDQQLTLDRLRRGFDQAVRSGIAYALAAGFKHVEVGVESMSCKTTAKLSLSLADPSVLHEVVDSLGRKVVLVLIDPAIFTEGLDRFVADADQPELDLPEPDDRPAHLVDPEREPFPVCQATFVQGGFTWGCELAAGHDLEHDFTRNLTTEDAGDAAQGHAGAAIGNDQGSPSGGNEATGGVCGERLDPNIAEGGASCILPAGHEEPHEFAAEAAAAPKRRRRKATADGEAYG